MKKLGIVLLIGSVIAAFLILLIEIGVATRIALVHDMGLTRHQTLLLALDIGMAVIGVALLVKGSDGRLVSDGAAWANRNMPTRETFERIRWLRPISHRILLPELWRFHRRSVPRGVALGVLVGVLIPVAQTVFAALFALPAKANVPVAALTTFITNPFTTPPIWVGAYWLGIWMLRIDTHPAARPIVTGVEGDADGWMRWLLSDAAPATAAGLVTIAIVGAAVGYLIAAFGWRWWIAHKWRARQLERAVRGV